MQRWPAPSRASVYVRRGEAVKLKARPPVDIRDLLESHHCSQRPGETQEPPQLKRLAGRIREPFRTGRGGALLYLARCQ
jgi:hypothetical protein